MPLRDRLPPELIAKRFLVARIVDGISSFASPHSKVDDGMLPEPAVDLPGFYSLVKTAIEDLQERAGISSQAHVLFSEEEPEFHTDRQQSGSITEYISYRLMDRLPGKVSAGRHGASVQGEDGRREWVPRLRYIKQEPGEILTKTLVMGQFFDNVVEFSCWAQTNKAANARALWFQDLMSSYRWFFKASGVSEVYFAQQLEDSSFDGKQGANKLKQRRLLFMVRTDRTFTLEESVLRHLLVKVGVVT